MMRRDGINRIRMAYVLLLSLIVSMLLGCAAAEETAPILLEPVDGGTQAVEVLRRDVYVLETYESEVIPRFAELSFEESGRMGEMLFGIGDTVRAGDTLARQQGDQDAYERILKQLTEMQSESAYANQLAELSIEKARLAGEDVARRELELKQARELQALDEAQLAKELSDAKKAAEGEAIIAPFDGTIVAAGKYQSGEYVAGETPLYAICDETAFYVTCEYFSEETVAKYSRAYALIAGKEYELIYEPYTSQELTQMHEKGQTPVSRFRVPGMEASLAGTYAMLCIESERAEDVISVPVNALYTEGNLQYVYVVDGERHERRDVKTGVSGVMYTEVCEGLEEGERVYVRDGLGNSTSMTLEKSDLIITAQAEANISYPHQEEVLLTSAYGAATFVQYLVEQGTYVQAGTPLVEITIPVDEIDRYELSLKVKRAREAYEAFLVNGAGNRNSTEGQNDAEQGAVLEAQIQTLTYERMLQKKKDALTELEKELAIYEEAAATTTIDAPCDGIVGKFMHFSRGDEIKNGARVGMMYCTDRILYEVSDAAGMLRYGLAVLLQDGEGNQLRGRVVSSNDDTLSDALRSEMGYVEVTNASSEETTLAQMRKGTAIYETIRIENVIVLPSGAYRIDAHGSYVNELTEGGAMRHYFTLGRAANEKCAVIDGLTEGMQIVYQ